MSRIDELVERLCPDGVDFHRLGEIATLVRGHGLPKSEFVPEGVGAIHYGQIYTHFGAWADEVISHVRPDAAARLAVVNPGDVILANTSENLEDVCKAVAWVGRGGYRHRRACDRRQALDGAQVPVVLVSVAQLPNTEAEAGDGNQSD